MFTELKEESEKLDGRDKIEEYIILGLRMTEGIDTADFKSRFGFLVEERYKNVIDKNIANGLLKLSGGKLYLTERGLDLANSVMVDFLD
ncbi:MAG: hypothetical protein K6E62_10850 [Lachnospiraceae bacterium]|nr:hypothetical protein [Lachnospiraceae bacterium]